MTNQPRTRQEIYDRIRESSKDEFIRDDMIRLGFWPATGTVPGDPAEEIARKAQVEAELKALQTEQTRLSNAELLKRELHKRRLLESRQKQKETKERRERERKERAEAWKVRKAGELLWVGEGVSGALAAKVSFDDRLGQQGLPRLSTAEQLAQAMGLSVGQLRFLAFDRAVSETSHYARFTLPKKTGGVRHISAPMPRLKQAQRWVLDHVLAKVVTDDAAHGFVPKRSIVTNAAPHVAALVVVNLDLRDFFPSIGYRRVRGVFRSLGYSDAVATLLGLLCSEPDVDEAWLDGKRYFVSRGQRRLPQGAPTSPALTNLLCRRLDRRLTGLARKLGFVYTRYADDLTFSARAPEPGAPSPDAGRLLRRVRHVVAAEGLTVHPQKTRVIRKGRKQEVTGVVVNERLSVDRAELKRFRALVFQLEKDGPAGKRWGESDDVLASAMGFANFVSMVTPDKGVPLRNRMKAVMAKWRPTASPAPAAQAPATPAAPAAPAVAEAAPQAPTTAPAAPPQGPTEPSPPEPKKKWWKIF